MDESGACSDKMIVYHVNWLRAKAQYTRWKEEHNMVRHEVQWTVQYFQYRKMQWQEQRMAVPDDMAGAACLRCYASKQEALWRQFSEKAMTQFRVEIPGLHFVEW